MHESLTIRAYTRNVASHQHNFCQLVLPLNGVIKLAMHTFDGAIGVGEGIVIPAGTNHAFSANEQARFVVADLAALPAAFARHTSPKFLLSAALSAYLQFVELQLQQSTLMTVETTLITLFKQLLTPHHIHRSAGDKIELAISQIHQYPESVLSLEVLCRHACLGVTQFKKRFREKTGTSPGQYITQVRMQKARSLLQFTDMPVTRVALEVGYNDVSAFSRRFTTVFGRSPKHFSRRIKTPDEPKKVTF